MSHSSVAIAQELIKDIEARIDSVDLSPDRVQAGIVSYLGDGIAKVVGLRNVAYNEVVTFESGAQGVAMNLEEHYVGVVILSGFSSIAEGMTAQ
jgi:F-type H+-transporting ATPase subunit alpha